MIVQIRRFRLPSTMTLSQELTASYYYWIAVLSAARFRITYARRCLWNSSGVDRARSKVSGLILHVWKGTLDCLLRSPTPAVESYYVMCRFSVFSLSNGVDFAHYQHCLTCRFFWYGAASGRLKIIPDSDYLNSFECDPGSWCIAC